MLTFSKVFKIQPFFHMKYQCQIFFHHQGGGRRKPPILPKYTPSSQVRLVGCSQNYEYCYGQLINCVEQNKIKLKIIMQAYSTVYCVDVQWKFPRKVPSLQHRLTESSTHRVMDCSTAVGVTDDTIMQLLVKFHRCKYMNISQRAVGSRPLRRSTALTRMRIATIKAAVQAILRIHVVNCRRVKIQDQLQY